MQRMSDEGLSLNLILHVLTYNTSPKLIKLCLQSSKWLEGHIQENPWCTKLVVFTCIGRIRTPARYVTFLFIRIHDPCPEQFPPQFYFSYADVHPVDMTMFPNVKNFSFTRGDRIPRQGGIFYWGENKTHTSIETVRIINYNWGRNSKVYTFSAVDRIDARFPNLKTICCQNEVPSVISKRIPFCIDDFFSPTVETLVFRGEHRRSPKIPDWSNMTSIKSLVLHNPSIGKYIPQKIGMPNLTSLRIVERARKTSYNSYKLFCPLTFRFIASIRTLRVLYLASLKSKVIFSNITFPELRTLTLIQCYCEWAFTNNQFSATRLPKCETLSVVSIPGAYMFHLCEGDVPQLKNATLNGLECRDMLTGAIDLSQFEIIRRDMENIVYKRL